MELDWWQSTSIKNHRITFLPTQHWSARGLNDKFNTLWGSYGIEIAKQKIYFAGDTGYSANFKLIQQRWGAPDLALLPIGSYLPAWFMGQNHMNPLQATMAHKDLGAKHSIAIHFRTFQLSDESIDQPVIDLQKAISAQQLAADAFVVLAEGESRLF
jgi:L-ascorbate metabolism protein UlaG (beta-lactamase superfamily)